MGNPSSRIRFNSIAGVSIVLAATVAIPGTVQAICFANETDRDIYAHVLQGTRTRWQLKLKPGRKACCTRHPLCRRSRVKFKIAYWYRYDPAATPKVRGLKIPGIGRVPAPVNPVMPHNRYVAGCWLIEPRNRTVRVYGRVIKNRNEIACEVWSGTRLVHTKWSRYNKPRLRGHVIACNRTRDLLSTAFAFYDRKRRAWRAQGWFNVKPGRCHVIRPPRGYRGTIYVNGHTSRTKWVPKDAYFCVNQRRAFNLIRADRRRCPRGYKKVGFFKRRPPGGQMQRVIFQSGR